VIAKLPYVLGLLILVALSIFTGGAMLVLAFPFMVLCLQKLGVVPT